MKALMMGSPYAKVHGIYRGLGNGVGCVDSAPLRTQCPRSIVCNLPVFESSEVDNGRVI
jgi:hypothetical protein